MTEKKEYQEFRRILREALGTDKQKEYAEKVGISPEHLNRLLNNNLINCPSKATLDQIIKASPWISASDLYRSCGYSFEEFRDSIRWKIHQMDPKDQIHAGNLELERTFKELINSREIYADWKEMVHDYRARFETQRFGIAISREEESENWMKERKGSYVRSCIAKWTINLDRERCWNVKTYFALYYVKLDNGSLIITDIGADGNTLGDLGYIQQYYLDRFSEDGMIVNELPYISITTETKRPKNSPEERLIDAIFGAEEDRVRLQTLSFGKGTIWEGVPERFHEYILENEEYFSETAKETEIVDEIRDAGGYTEAVEKLADDYVYNATQGPAAIAVAILTRKSDGYEIRYDESVDGIFEPAIYISEDTYTVYEKVDQEKLDQIDAFLSTEFKAMGFHTYGHVFVYKDISLTNKEIEGAQRLI